MKTIVIGFDNAKGTGDGEIIKGLSVSQADQIKFIHDAKRDNKLPEGVKYLAFCVIEERITAIAIEPTEPAPKATAKKPIK